MGPSPFSERSLGGWAATPLLSVAAPLNAGVTRIVTFSCLSLAAAEHTYQLSAQREAGCTPLSPPPMVCSQSFSLCVLAGLWPITSPGRRKAMNQVISLLIGAIVIIVLVYIILTLL